MGEAQRKASRLMRNVEIRPDLEAVKGFEQDTEREEEQEPE